MNPDGRSASFVPAKNLPGGRQLRVYLSGSITDSVGNGLPAYAFYFNTSFNTDSSAPSVQTIAPADALIGVPTNAAISIQFSEPISSVSVQKAIQLYASEIPIAGSVALWSGNSIATLTPITPLIANTTYMVRVSGDVADVAGNVMGGAVVTMFTTGSGADLVRPSVSWTDPVNNATGVATNAVVRVQFSERVNPLTVNGGTLQVIRYSDWAVIPGSIVVSADGLSASWTGTLAPSTFYYLYLSTGVTDLAGNTLNGYGSYFTTGMQ